MFIELHIDMGRNILQRVMINTIHIITIKDKPGYNTTYSSALSILTICEDPENKIIYIRESYDDIKRLFDNE